MRKLIFLLLVLISFEGRAGCPLADSFFQKGKTAVAISFLRSCAINYNDDESQAKLAKAYTKGEYGLERNSREALYFFQLSAENGNAESQLALAQLLLKSDEKPKTRDALLSYRSKLATVNSKAGKSDFNGDFMHPYALLMLASESPDKKWYYPSQVRNAPPKALSMYRTYKIDNDKKKVALRQASQFKTRKLLQVAEEVYSDEDYPDIETRLKSPQTQKQALSELKQKMEDYIQEKKKFKKAK